MSRGRIALLVVSPRLPAALMTRDAWRAVEDAPIVLARDESEPLAEAVADAGIDVTFVGATSDGGSPPDALARELVACTEDGDVAWLGSADADPGLTDALASELTRLDDPPAVEVVVGSWDAPGARLLDAVAVMDTLRSPGGCPWDAKQTHSSLAPYLVEEAFEVTEAIAEADNAHLQEELGDVLLQVLFHARVASERAGDGFDIDGVAATLVEKLIRRHPHVFSDAEAADPDAVEAQWAAIKAQEKPERDVNDPLAGIPAGMPPLERAVKVVSRLTKAGRTDLVLAATEDDSVGAALLDLVVQAQGLGVDPAVSLSATLSGLTRAARVPGAPHIR